MDRTGSGDDGDAQPSRTFVQAAAEASDDTSEVVRCVLCKDEIRGEPVMHGDGTLWHFGCDRQCEESDKNWEESVVQAAERKAQRKHDKRARQTDHASRWRDAIRGEKREANNATALAAREEPADGEPTRDADDVQSGGEQQVDGGAEREMGRDERGDDLPSGFGDRRDRTKGHRPDAISDLGVMMWTMIENLTNLSLMIRVRSNSPTSRTPCRPCRHKNERVTL